MDRSSKRLYRQRGSHLRRTVDLDNVVVIKTPLRTASNNDTNVTFTHTANSDDRNVGLFGLNDSFHDVNDNTNSNNNNIGDDFRHGVQMDTTIEPNYNQIHSYDRKDVNWKNIPVSKISLISINVLQSIFNHIIKNILILKANNDLKNLHENSSVSTTTTNTNNIQSLMYSIDLKIFNNLLNSINKDFNDIKDINIANNELYYQLQRLKRLKRKLTLQLINTKKECNHLKETAHHGHHYNNINNNSTSTYDNIQSKLNDKLILNQNLNKLTRILAKKGLPSELLISKKNNAKSQNILLSLQVNDTNLLKINKLCQLLDPYNGVLSKIKEINRRLSKLPKSSKRLKSSKS